MVHEKKSKMSSTENKSRSLAAVVLVLGYLIPGAGHLLLGRPVRALIIFVVIAATFWAGVSVGGVMTVDRQAERWWFCAQVLSGAHGLVAWQMNERIYVNLEKKMEQDSNYQLRMRRATQAQADVVHQASVEQFLADDGLALVPPADTVARAYSGVAGMLNLMCVFDAFLLALMGVRGEPTKQQIVEGESA